MAMDRKKELKLQYKLTKPDMGIFVIKNSRNRKCHLQTANDLRAVINGANARLRGGGHPVRELQKEWDELGGENFTIEILERLSYDADESKTDYSEELELLKMIWEEKLSKQNVQFYQKRV